MRGVRPACARDLEATRNMTSTAITSPGERVTVGCFLDPSLKRALIARAQANDRTLSAELRTAIRHHLDDHERTHPMHPDHDQPTGAEPSVGFDPGQPDPLPTPRPQPPVGN